MKKQIIVTVLVCGACFALCSCGKNKATTFTTDDIDTFVNSVNGNSSSTDSSDSDNYDDDSDLYDSDGYGDYNSEDSSDSGDDSDLFGFESERESNDRAAVDSVASAFCVTVANLGAKVPNMNDVTYDQMDSVVLQEMENYLGKTIQEVESEFESNACKGKRLHFYFNNSESRVKVGVGSLDGTLNQNNKFDFHYPV